ncbi:LysR family transcriptional regulator [Ruegeria sp. Ofav3-42]|uniref:LysR family transcriptional regulator n=1 Tax=Ruegeria sp. Ofav3-42 TaxID=2917759 RepID=UPI001EF667F7|nr:LysR family transcriptional regulator [Ruegeria sp. Ofav3-42]MCG7521814.1 LysR family transcriptional regulator [Ruegeria sp. Ofav3-42]
MEKSNLNRLEYFVAIAEAGTITAAADRMRVSKAVVSKQLQLLEEELGATLVVRNSRHLNLTEIGHSFYSAAQASVAQAEEAYAMVRRGSAEPSGTLRITAPLDLGSEYVAPVVASFRRAYPAVKIDLMLSDTRMDPVEARFDIAYRVGWLADSANIARKIAGFRQIVVASVRLAEEMGESKSPSDLEKFPFIEHQALSNPLRWRFSAASGETADIEMTRALSADVTPAIKAMTLEGAGISILPDFYVRKELADKSLIQLLPDWSLPSGGIYSVYPPTQYRSTATQRFAQLFHDYMRKELA